MEMDEQIVSSEGDQTAEQTTGSDGSGSSGSEDNEKKFTQSDVDRIVKDRLKRARTAKAEEAEDDLKKRADALEQQQADLKIRETKLSCKEYLTEKGYPRDLLDIIDQNDFNEFKKKADKVMQLASGFKKRVAPIANLDRKPSESGDGFSKDLKHTPKPYY